jgi:predicted DNA-binding protein (MmcQ/YjbR family)
MVARPRDDGMQVCLEVHDRRLASLVSELRMISAVGVKKIFAMYAHPDDHHGAGRHGVWLKAAPGNQALMVRDRPDRFFVPPYVGSQGWIGVYLDKRAPWKEIAQLVEESWRLVRPGTASRGSAATARTRRRS